MFQIEYQIGRYNGFYIEYYHPMVVVTNETINNKFDALTYLNSILEKDETPVYLKVTSVCKILI